MPSPTIVEACKKFSMIKSKLGINSTNFSSYLIMLFLLYPVLVILSLIYFKPKIVMEKDTEEKTKISYKKLIIWFIIFLSPLVLYFLLRSR